MKLRYLIVYLLLILTGGSVFGYFYFHALGWALEVLNPKHIIYWQASPMIDERGDLTLSSGMATFRWNPATGEKVSVATIPVFQFASPQPTVMLGWNAAHVDFQGTITYSGDEGTHWTTVYTPRKVATIDEHASPLRQLIDVGKDHIIFRSESDSNLIASFDMGRTWLDVQDGLGSYYLTAIFASQGGQIYGITPSGSHVFTFDNKSRTWSEGGISGSWGKIANYH